MDIREDLLSEVRKYFVGPRSDSEMLPPIPNFPIDYYVSGILFPKNAAADVLDKDEFETGGYDDKEAGTAVEQSAPQVKQNTVGLRVDIKDGVKTLKLEIDYGKYQNEDKGWKRIPLESNKRNHTVNLNEGMGSIKIEGIGEETDAVVTWVLDEGEVDSVRYRVLNVFLENGREWRNYDRDKDDFALVRIENNLRTIFQPVIKIYSDVPVFRNYRPISRGGIKTREDQSLDLLYRDSMVYGEGSNCAAKWDSATEPLWVSTDFTPSYVARSVGKESEDPNDNRPKSIDLHSLAYADGDDDEKYKRQFEENMRPLVDGYDKWIKEMEKKITRLENEEKTKNYVPAARNNIEQCRKALTRMKEGLEFLTDQKNKTIRLAFALANRAMLYQRQHYEYALNTSKGKKPGAKPDPTQPGRSFWYPFQIAFFLMNLKGVVDKSSPDRSIVDLLWFPTGGGKTEAYLAVAAFVMLYRRMRGTPSEGLGVSVIMRYTLRLLTLQQFERASTLMCSLEFLRRTHKKYGLGEKPFLVGLWVGYNLTPNSYQQSEEALKLQKNPRNPESVESSPVQLIYCPWCGSKIGPWDYIVSSTNNWTVAHCSDNDCFFYSENKSETERALPVLTVDSDIYRRCPSLVIATVDKFARMPYRPEISSLFGRVEKLCERHGFLTSGIDCGAKTKHADGRILKIDPLERPDLIIQDELHLITGPLGSMVGLYEAAVDYLCQRNSNGISEKPKIIVSTATIRGVDMQIKKLFNRDPPQKFPPPGIDKDDSFFWWESKERGREYVGVSFSHRSAKFSLARLYASLLQRVGSLSKSTPETEIDPYWTLVGYFNSIRELGGALRLVEDDVVSNILYITSLIPEFLSDERRQPGKAHQGMEELTGRITQNGIRNIREKLEKTKNDLECINTLLATNMISVGIDIERLGLMVVNGQTKNASEYIQATGRIGRRKEVPGLIFTLYNPYKPRDLSHYENFMGYHSMLQKYVEPSTLTPFSVGAIERALHAVFIAMIRLSIPRLSQKESANNFDPADADDVQSFILKRFLDVQQVDVRDQSYDDIKKYITSFKENWAKFIKEVEEEGRSDKGVWYNNPYRPKIFSEVEENPNILMIEFAKKTEDVTTFPKATPESMRNVEKQIQLRYYD